MLLGGRLVVLIGGVRVSGHTQNHSNLQNFELRHKCLLTANPCKYLRETRGTTHKRQVRFNDYAYDKNKVHPKELVQYLANMLTQ